MPNRLLFKNMALLEILKFPDPRLRQKAQAVGSVTPELKQLAKDMMESMQNKKGVGLAAVQAGRPVRLLIADTRSEFVADPSEPSRYPGASVLKQDLARRISQPLVLFNPQITKKEGHVVFPEGCLSFPSYFAKVKRAEIIELRAIDPEQKEVFIRTDGLLSICLQHEIDHLDGKLFIDHLSPMKARRLRDEIKKNGYPEERKDAPAAKQFI